ncbi:MAG: hypothetical protein Q9160_005695 [Pyrenula sp. 1 TL-2023]
MSSPFKKLVRFHSTPSTSPVVDLLSTNVPCRTATASQSDISPKASIQDPPDCLTTTPNELLAPLQASFTQDSTPTSDPAAQSTVQRPSELKQGFTTKLIEFDHVINQSYHNRFNDLKELIDQPLFDYLSKGNIYVGTVSLKMRVLGKSQEQAKPWIIVLCSATFSRRARRFFKQKHIKELCHGESQADMPSFDVVVCDCPPSLRTEEGQSIVYTSIGKEDLGALKTLCGLPIAVNVGNQTRLGSLGGLIVIEHLGGQRLYGLTTRHIFQPIPDELNDGQLTKHDSSFSSDDDLSDDGSEIFELDLSLKQRVEFTKNSSVVPESFVKNTTRDLSTCEVGRLSPWISDDAKNCDWALIELTISMSESSYPNLLRLADTHVHIQNLARLSSHTVSSFFPNEDVMILSSNGTKMGHLFKFSDGIILPPETSFKEAYTLRLSGKEVLDDGDSGAWVVGSTSHCIYGQVVASDVLGDVYVIPAMSILQQIGICVGDTARVRLPQQKVSKAEHSKQSAPDAPAASQVNSQTPEDMKPRSPSSIFNLLNSPYSASPATSGAAYASPPPQQYQHFAPISNSLDSPSSTGLLASSTPTTQQYQLVTPYDERSMSLDNKEELINALRLNRYNTITDLRRVERIFTYLDEEEVVEPMARAWRHYVDSQNFFAELKTLTRNYPFGSECVDEAKILVQQDPASIRSWNYCWLILVKIQNE